ncbi:hypothetical protein EAO75_44085 [Streptomyces sp. uw30]|uniref:hypothetical protein n=1 Tax=Streptomyces sp. uw30 TaxID=1828179 RepID=UPI0011CD4528|nr:hypothetical protein [Streptomyces sp. uw30]TXS35535.1 hypothetical protein EAO75_44085 [Streptomyces sp. uw30]
MRKAFLGVLMALAAVFAVAPLADAGQMETAAAAVPAGAADTVTSGSRPAVAGKGEGDVSVKRAFSTWATNVNVRHNNSNLTTCGMSPSTANCPNIRGQVNPGVSFEVWCQKIGSQTVGGNPYWVYIILPNFEGWMASYYVDYPDDVLPETRSC